MVGLCAIAALILAYFGLSLYVRKATEYLKASQPVWDDLYASAQVVVEDPDMPGGMASFAAASVLCAGCGCLTMRILQDIITGQFKKRVDRDQRDPNVTREQRMAFGRVVVLAVYYDSLQAPFLGFLLRRVAMPWLADAAKGKPALGKNVARAALSSREAISEKPEGRRVLALA